MKPLAKGHVNERGNGPSSPGQAAMTLLSATWEDSDTEPPSQAAVGTPFPQDHVRR